MKRKISFIIRYAVLLSIALSATVFLYWLYSTPTNALIVSPNPIPVETKIVKEDGTCKALGLKRCAIIKFTQCKSINATGRVVITLVGIDTRIPLPIAYDKADRGCKSDQVAPIPVPSQAALGTYHFHFTVTYKINPLNRIPPQEFDTQDFVVE